MSAVDPGRVSSSSGVVVPQHIDGVFRGHSKATSVEARRCRRQGKLAQASIDQAQHVSRARNAVGSAHGGAVYRNVRVSGGGKPKSVPNIDGAPGAEHTGVVHIFARFGGTAVDSVGYTGRRGGNIHYILEAI